MKISTKQVERIFEPFTVTITIESQKELDSLVARLAIQSEDVNRELSSDDYNIKVTQRATFGVTIDLFRELHEIAERIK